MIDPIFDHPRLAAIYDDLDPDRGDLDAYAAIAAEFDARTVLDVGCGTGTFALLLADRGLDVIGIDPARASLDVARGKPGADRVHWVHGDASALPALQVDLATMTANVAQAIVAPDAWAATLRGVHAALRTGGRLVFETRDPARRAWESWNRETSYDVTDLAGVGEVESWVEVTHVDGPLVTFRWTWVFASDGAVLTSDSTLRWRERDEIAADLTENGYVVDEVREAPDRPGRELVFVARRASRPRYGRKVIDVRGPYFEELSVGQVFDSAPAVTLTGGLAAAHQAVVGSRLRLPLSEPLARAVAGRAPLADPVLVWDLAIGHSSLVTQQVRANLFYRGLVLRRLPAVGDTLSTVTTIAALKQNRVREDRPATGLAVLHIVTSDQEARTVLDFQRCAMIPLSDPSADTGWDEPLRRQPTDLADETLLAAIDGWAVPAGGQRIRAGAQFRISGADVVSAAPELARLTLNIAAVHHDAAAAGGRRLVYGGHTIALALLQATRALPGLLTVLGWHSCDHLAPVHEGDQLTSTLEVERADDRPEGGQVLHLRSRVSAVDEHGGAASDVLDWRFVALHG